MDDLLVKKTISHNNTITAEVSFTYDNSDRLVERLFRQTNTPYSRKWVYDHNEDIISIKTYESFNGNDFVPRNNEIRRFTFDKNDNLISYEITSDNDNRTAKFVYDKNNNIISMQSFFPQENILDVQAYYVYVEFPNPLYEIFVNTYGKKQYQIEGYHYNVERNKSPNALKSFTRNYITSNENYQVNNALDDNGVLNNIDIHFTYGTPQQQGRHKTELFYD